MCKSGFLMSMGTDSRDFSQRLMSTRTNSLALNILRISPYVPIFYGGPARSGSLNSHAANNLGPEIQKNDSDLHKATASLEMTHRLGTILAAKTF